MFIRIHLPARYQRLQSIKTDNFPYHTLFQAYMRSVAQLAEREQLNLFTVFGRIEHALANDAPLMFPDDGQNPVSLDYKEEDPEVVSFYKNSPLTQKKTTLMFIRTLLRLTGKYGNSIPELVYLIDTLPVADAIHEPVTSAAPMTSSTASAASKISVARSNTSSQKSAAASEPEPVDPKTMVHIKKRAGKAAMTDVVKRAHKVADKITAPDPTPVKAEKQTDAADDVLKRAEQLKRAVDDGTGKSAEGQKVETNALLSQFM